MTALRILLVLASAGLGVCAHASSLTAATPADDTTSAARMPGARRASTLVAALDLNGDGTLSAAEISNAPIILRALDANGDGVLTSAELRREPRARSHSPMAVMAVNANHETRISTGFNLAFTLDANHDGEIQQMEIANAVSSLKTLDVNRDGQITPDEMRPSAVGTLTTI